MVGNYQYVRSGRDIYEQSFATIRREADLRAFSGIEEKVAVRLVHTSGDVDLTKHIKFSKGFGEAARGALLSGAPVLCDANMIVAGVTRARLPRSNKVLCFLNHPDVPKLACGRGTTRSAAALELWRRELDGALVAIGNAPTAMFRLLEMLAESDVRPAAIIGVPVGFVGARESKQALVTDSVVPWMTVEGRRGGSALAVAAINALAKDEEL